MKKALLAEFIGTFALIFIGAGAVAISGELVVAALAHGLVVMGFIYAYGHLSGTHINPAVTLGLLIVGESDWQEAIGYWLAQLLGGTAGAFALWLVLFGTGIQVSAGMTVLADGVTLWSGVLIEAVLTFFLMNAILNADVSGKAGKYAGLAIGGTLVFAILMGGPLTGASLNPARTLGPALVGLVEGNDMGIIQTPLYLVGTLGGAAVAAVLYRFGLSRNL